MPPLCQEGRISLFCFIGTLIIVFVLSLSEYIFDYVPNVWGALLWGPLLYYFIINISLRLYYKEQDYQVEYQRKTLKYFNMCRIICLSYSRSPFVLASSDS